ncbi:hypothetical protein AAG570_001412 [Ranatra chinensis]|uniref:Uncharacterized protein n=1 Tax=Ranatra chinensis TaxID=642074 RepID=A0ABD0YC32_9HEMI
MKHVLREQEAGDDGNSPKPFVRSSTHPGKGQTTLFIPISISLQSDKPITKNPNPFTPVETHPNRLERLKCHFSILSVHLSPGGGDDVGGVQRPRSGRAPKQNRKGILPGPEVLDRFQGPEVQTSGENNGHSIVRGLYRGSKYKNYKTDMCRIGQEVLDCLQGQEGQPQEETTAVRSSWGCKEELQILPEDHRA